MLYFGTIGTSWITSQFIESAHATGLYQLGAVYSRGEFKGKALAKPYNAKVFTDLDVFLAYEKIEVVYIASPNSLHYEQAKKALLAGKHIIVEKPAFANEDELLEILALAKRQNCFFFEAARNIHEEKFKLVKQYLPKKILGANFTYAKYSSRYNQVLAGEEPNIFSLEFAGGALMDLGIYLIYAAVAWFGKPLNYDYYMRKVTTGVDGTGMIILRYPDFDVTLQTGKNITSFLPCEIYGEKETLLMDSVTGINNIQLFQPDTKQFTLISGKRALASLSEEAEDFANILLQPENPIYQKEYQQWLEWAKIVHHILTKLRRQTGLVFPNDLKNK